MLYEYPDKFIVPITYINTSDYNIEKHEIKYTNCNIKNEVKNLVKGKLREFREYKNSEDMLEYFVDADMITESYKEYYLENIDVYVDVDDEYIENETKKK